MFKYEILIYWSERLKANLLMRNKTQPSQLSQLALDDLNAWQKALKDYMISRRYLSVPA